MLKSFEIINCQSHKKSSAVLHPNVTIFKGTSHHGKSTIRRMLKWASLNSIQGSADAYKSTFAKKDEEFYCKVEFEEGSIRRGRNRKSNFLEISGNPTPLEALRSDIPEELSNLTRMSELNFQGQHDKFFLLQDTPGVRGERLNKLLGLEIITESIDTAKKIVKDTKDKIKFYSDELQGKADALEEHKDFPSREKLVKTINENFSVYQERIERHQNLSILIDRISTTEATLNDLSKDIEALKGDFKLLSEAVSKLKSMRDQFASLGELINTISEKENKIKQFGEMVKQKVLIDSLRKSYQTFKEKQTAYTQLRSLCDSISTLNGAITLQEQRIQKFAAEKTQILKEHGSDFCSVCGAYRTHWRKNQQHTWSP